MNTGLSDVWGVIYPSFKECLIVKGTKQNWLEALLLIESNGKVVIWPTKRRKIHQKGLRPRECRHLTTGLGDPAEAHGPSTPSLS